jgi:hypothetical protein
MSKWTKYDNTVQIAACMVIQNGWTLDEAADKAKKELFKQGLLVHMLGLKTDIKNRTSIIGKAELAWLTRM